MKNFVKTHTKLLIGITAALVLVLVWAWFAGSARQQNSFHRTDERIVQAKNLVAKTEKGNQSNRLAAIGLLASLERSSTCQGDWWNNWQQAVLPSTKTDAERCRTKERSLTKVTQAAKAAKLYIADESKITKQISSLTVDSTAKDWPARAEKAAVSAGKALNGILVVSSVQPVKKASETRVGAIISAWNSLNTASNKQDKDAYLTAEAQLKQAYVDLAAISDVSDAQLLKVLGTLTSATKTL